MIIMTKKGLLCVFLSIIMLLSVFPVSAFEVNNNDNIIRYTVLILDASGSMSGTPTSVQKQAAIKFCESLASDNGTNYIALVKINTSSSLVKDFTTDITALETYINSLPASGGTNINQSLTIADNLLSSIDKTQNSIIKNIVLCSDGLPESGNYSYTGPYTSSDYYDYGYANSAYDTANKLKGSYTIYTLGFFHDLYDSELAFGRRFMNDIQNGGYYEVTDVDELEFTFGEVADDIINEVKEITFTYQSGNDYAATCYYTNDYFVESSYTYNPSLATMSLSYAMSAFGSSKDGGNYSNKSVNAQQLLKDIGVPEENIETNDWFTKKPTTDSIGVIAGNMPITVKGKDYTLIALAVRGGGYEQEWASNFTIGSSGQHSGFNTAKDNVISFLRSYIENQNITGAVKFWITGYSRAAATANLVGGALDNGTSVGANISYDYKDIYTYCFETPAGTLTSRVKGQTKYKNIFNIINSSDLVPYVAPAAMGFGRYGVDKYLPSAESDPNNYGNLKYEMLKVYNNLPSTDAYIVDNFQMKKVVLKNILPGGKSPVQDDTKNNYSQGLFLSNYITILSNDFVKNRNNYVSNYQAEIREICSVMFGCTDAQFKKVIEYFGKNWKPLLGSLISGYLKESAKLFWANEEKALQVISDSLKAAFDYANITNYDEKTIDAAGKKLGDLALALLSNHPNYAATAFSNGSGLFAARYPELCYSWLASMDKNYIEGAKEKFNNGGHRIVRINCPVDIDVYDENNNIIASIENEEPVSLSQSSYIYGIDADGQKYVVLPVDSDYQISITARENTQVNYGIDEYSALSGAYTRNINYLNVDLKQGDSITGIIPSYSETEVEEDTPDGSSVKYSLLNENNEEITADSNLSGEDVSRKYYTVNVESDNPNAGIAIGSSTHKYGEFAQIEAIALDGYKFSGWYSNGKLQSSEPVYRLCVTENIELTAKFNSDNCMHKNTELRNANDSTCSSNGYTGDLYCLDCGTIIKYGKTIPATGFVDKDGDGLCDECGVDENNHTKSNKSILNSIKDIIRIILNILEIVFTTLKVLNVGNGPYADLLSAVHSLQRSFGFV